jgi:hypothetical protein
MPPEEQSYTSHRRFHPIFHFFAFPILALNVLVSIYWFVKYPRWQMAWGILVAIALATIALLARFYSLRQQDRIIRLEERLRLQTLLPDDLRSRINELRTAQLISLRFCSDEELADATRAVLAGEVTSANDIKRRVKLWRPDHHRI